MECTFKIRKKNGIIRIRDGGTGSLAYFVRGKDYIKKHRRDKLGIQTFLLCLKLLNIDMVIKAKHHQNISIYTKIAMKHLNRRRFLNRFKDSYSCDKISNTNSSSLYRYRHVGIVIFYFNKDSSYCNYYDGYIY